MSTNIHIFATSEIPCSTPRGSEDLRVLLAKYAEDASWVFLKAPLYISAQYIIDRHGAVVTLPRNDSYIRPTGLRVDRYYKPKFLKPGRHPDGRLQYTIRKNGKPFTAAVHQWMMWSWYGPPDERLDITHLDKDLTNNNLDNLAYIPPNNRTTLDSSTAAPGTAHLLNDLRKASEEADLLEIARRLQRLLLSNKD